jgi:hypothetical protein
MYILMYMYLDFGGPNVLGAWGEGTARPPPPPGPGLTARSRRGRERAATSWGGEGEGEGLGFRTQEGVNVKVPCEGVFKQEGIIELLLLSIKINISLRV